MATRFSSQDVIEKIVKTIDSGRLRADLLEDLEEEPFTKFEEWAEALSEIANEIETVRDAVETWRDCEDREEKTEAREEALEALDNFVNLWNGSPLDLSKLEDYVEEEA